MEFVIWMMSFIVKSDNTMLSLETTRPAVKTITGLTEKLTEDSKENGQLTLCNKRIFV